MPDPIRKRLHGFTDYHDRLWKIKVADSEEAISEYKGEIVASTPGLWELPEISQHIHHGGNAYRVLGELRRLGAVVTLVNDR